MVDRNKLLWWLYHYGGKYGSFIRHTFLFSLSALVSYQLSIQSAPELCPRIQNQFMENNGTNFPTEFTNYRFYYNHAIYKPVYKFECLYPIGRIAAGSKLILNNNATQIGFKPRGSRSLEQTGENEFLTEQSMNLQIDVHYTDYIALVHAYHFLKIQIMQDFGLANATENIQNQPELGEVPYGGFEIWSQNEVEEPAEKPSLVHSVTWFIMIFLLYLSALYFTDLVVFPVIFCISFYMLWFLMIFIPRIFGCAFRQHPTNQVIGASDRSRDLPSHWDLPPARFFIIWFFLIFIPGIFGCSFREMFRQHPTNQVMRIARFILEPFFHSCGQVMRPSDRSRDLPGVSDLPPGYENIGEYPKVESSPPPYKAPTDSTV